MEVFILSWIVHKALTKAVEKFPEKPFLIMDNEQSITFRKLDEISDYLASALLEEGFNKGDYLGILALNQVEWLYTYFATAKIGVGLVALDVRCEKLELEYMLKSSKVKGLICNSTSQDFDFASFINNNKTMFNIKKYIFIGEGFDDSLSFEELIYREPNRKRIEEAKELIREDDTVAVIYTSGTMGWPKGTMLTNKSILTSAKALVEHLSLDECDSITGSIPLSHYGGLTCTVHAALLSYGKVILIPNPLPESVLEVIHKYKPTVLNEMPANYTKICNYKGTKKYDVSSVKICIVGGSNVDTGICQGIINLFTEASLVNLYGLTETSGACLLTKLSDPVEKAQKSIGVPIGDFQAKIVDSEKNELSVGLVGEIVIKGNCIAKGYLELKEGTQNTFNLGNWLFTGDLGYMDHEGYIYYKGQKAEVFRKGECNIYPVEVEKVISSHHKVSAVAGIGGTDLFFGAVDKYFIIPKEGVSVKEDELKDYCRKHLADFKVPKEIVFVEQLPLTLSGKVQKFILKK